MHENILHIVLTYINSRLLVPFERFIRRLNENLLQETKIRTIGSTVTILDGGPIEKVDYNVTLVESTVVFTLESFCHNDNEIEIRTGHEINTNNFEHEYRNGRKYVNLIKTFYNNSYIPNLFIVISFIIFTLAVGSFVYLATKILMSQRPARNRSNMSDSDSRLCSNKECWVLNSSTPSCVHTTFDEKTRLYVNAKACITDNLSKNVSDILNNNPPFFSYDFIIDEYEDEYTTDLEYRSWNCLSDFSQRNSIQTNWPPKDSKYLVEGVTNKNIGSPDTPTIYHSDSSLESANSTSPQTIESDIQNNMIVTDDEFETNQQYCLQSLLKLYDDTHNNTISCFPIKIETDFNHNIIERSNKNDKHAKEAESQNLNIELDFNECQYTDISNETSKRNKPFTKKSRAKYSPLYSRPRFELSPATAALISNQDQDPLIFFDLYDYLSLLDLNDKLDSLEILSHEYVNDASQVSHLIEFEILNLCTTSNEAEIQDTVKKLRYIFTTQYKGDNECIPKIIQLYSNSFKKHLVQITGLFQTPFGETVGLLICDYLSFADNNKITIETYKFCLEAIFESTESNIGCCKILSNSAAIIVCALDAKMLEYTFFEIFNQIFMNENLQMNKLLAALSSLKYYICYNKKKILAELTANPMENKAECCGYKMLNLLASNVTNIIQQAQKYKIKKIVQLSKNHKSLARKPNTNPLILELIDTYLVIIEVFLTNDQVPSAVQYEFLSSFITRIYTELKPIADQDARTLDPPLLKELQVYFELSSSQLR